MHSLRKSYEYHHDKPGRSYSMTRSAILLLLAFLAPLSSYAQSRVNFVIRGNTGEAIGANIIIPGTNPGYNYRCRGEGAV